jgi:hypothetical protein
MYKCDICCINTEKIIKVDNTFFRYLCEKCHIIIHNKTPEKLYKNNVFNNSNKMKAFSNGEPMEKIEKIKNEHAESIFKRLDAING